MNKKVVRFSIKAVIITFLILNVVTAFHAYKFTHFSSKGIRMDNIQLNLLEELKIFFTGVDNPRPVNTQLPQHSYQTIAIKSNVKIECWYIPTTNEKLPLGTLLIFHGYTSKKSALLNRAEPFIQNGYNCLLVDFMGSGGSEGNQTTIGFKEAEEVKDCFRYVTGTGEKNIYLLGSSLGAVAIMKAIQDYGLQPKGVILECPFGTMYQTVVARFNLLHIPPIPLAAMLLFWGSIENGFWGFAHNPVNYAKAIKCPVLLQWGALDDKVSEKEINDIYANLNCPKKLIVYPKAGHDNYLVNYKTEWTNNILEMMAK